MGDYTELVLGVRLKRNKKVFDILKFMLFEKGIEDIKIPDHDLFKVSDRWKYMLKCGSAYFGGRPDSKLVWDNDLETYCLNVRCNFKNYNNEIELFLDWLRPYIWTTGFIGYYKFEYDDYPVLIYNNKDKVTLENYL